MLVLKIWDKRTGPKTAVHCEGLYLFGFIPLLIVQKKYTLKKKEKC